MKTSNISPATESESLVTVSSSTSTSSSVFFTIGDWGSGNDIQHKVAAVMNDESNKRKPGYVLALGDNFYENGVISTWDPQWKKKYNNVYTADGLNVPFYALLGNHDYQFNPQAQIDYYKKNKDPKKRWIMEDYFYTKTFSMGNDGVTVQILFLDTVSLAFDVHMKALNELVYDWNMLDKAVLDRHEKEKEIHLKRGEDQAAWIESTLASSTADWLIVAGHYPVYSGGEHGNTDTLITNLEPLLSQYNVDLYLNGHDHTLQHLENKNITYLVSGAGGKTGSYTATPQSVYGGTDPGFMVHTLSPDGNSMTVEMIDMHGKVIYTTSVNKKTRVAVTEKMMMVEPEKNTVLSTA